MIISVESLFQGYGSVEVLKDITFSARSGEILALLGPNGCGKSTLIKTMCDVMPIASGKVTIDGQDLSSMELIDRAKLISYVPQSCPSAPFTTVVDAVMIGRHPYAGWSYAPEDVEIVTECLRTMNILDLSGRYVSELSGGQMQRVFLARALAQRPAFYMFDEPTSSLDLRHQMDTMISMRAAVKKENSGMVVALHDLNLAMNYADKVLMIKDQSIYAYGNPRDVLTEESVKSVYGVDSVRVENRFGRFILPYTAMDERPSYFESTLAGEKI